MKIRIFSTLLFFTLICAGCFLLFLPYLADTYLFPRIVHNLPFAEKEISLSRISLWKLRGTATFADKDQNTLSLPGIEFNFSPRSLLKRRIDSILIDGGTLHLNLDNLNQKRHNNKQQTSKQHNKPSPFILPIACNTFIIKDISFILHSGGKKYHFVINGHLNTNFKDLESGKKQFSSVTAKFHSTGALTLFSEATLQPKNEAHELLFTVSSPDISRITYLFPEIRKFSPEGQLALSGSLEVEDLKQISKLQATAHLSKFRSVLGSVILGDISSQKPLTITVKKDKETIYSEIKNLLLASPQESSVDMRGEYSLENKTFTGTGKVAIQTIPLPINFLFSGNQTASETWLKFNSSTDSFSIGEASPLLFDPLSIHGEMNISKEIITGKVNGSVDRISLPSEKVEFQDISLSLPLQFPFNDKNSSAGTFRVGSIDYNSTPSGSITGKISLNSAGVLFSTRAVSPFAPDLQVQCAGTLTMDKQGELTCHIPETHIDSVSFPPFLNIPPEISIEGDLSVKAEFSATEKNMGGRLHLQFNDGTVNISENQFSSINVAISLPNLPLLQSSPSQLCTIGSMQFGNINFSDAKVYFRLENPKSIFIEKSTFAWCGGKVESGGFRLSTTKQELEATLYCDRLNFTQLLSQFGIEDTEGEGSLNGRLPILLSENSITFDDGFLFSTPGDSGIVRFNNSSQLRQGMGAIDQTPYLDYSMQALENFSYNWAKLTFNSQEEDLLIKMQIDGKPAVPLPFGYKKGYIVPSEKGPGLQHPILLDVNFRLPMAHLFQYGKNMQSIMENM